MVKISRQIGDGGESGGGGASGSWEPGEDFVFDILDLIKVPNLTGDIPAGLDPSYFECFQQPTMSLTSGEEPLGIMLQEPDTFPDALWLAQDQVINSQSGYLDDVKATFNAKNKYVPKQEDLTEYLLKELVEWGAGWSAGKLATYFWGPVAGEIAQYVVALAGEAIEFLKLFYTEGGALCDAMKAENAAILGMTMSAANYDRRYRILLQHDQAIENLLRQVATAEAIVTQPKEELSGAWKDWLEDIVENIEEIDEWFDAADEAAEVNNDADAENDVPAPVPPSLPPIPPTTDTRVLVLYYLLRYGIKFGVYLIKRWIEKRGDDKLIEALKDLQFNEMEMKIPNSNLRMIWYGKAIRYGGE